jgi:outer membrane immunogenic protein
MRRVVFAGLAAIAAAPAFAADLPPRMAPPIYAPAAVAAPAFSWTGIYIGGHVGGGFSDEKLTDVFGAALTPGTQISSSPSGFLGGGQIGANYQMGQWVLGIEAAGSWANLKTTTTTPSTVFAATNLLTTSDPKWLLTVTGRLGYAAGPWLWYVLGGGAWESVDYTVSGSNGGVTLTAPVLSDTRSGWVAGGGVEYAFAGNWSAKVEYNFVDLGTQRYTFNIPTAPVLPVTADINSQIHVVKGALNYRFGWGGY